MHPAITADVRLTELDVQRATARDIDALPRDPVDARRGAAMTEAMALEGEGLADEERAGERPRPGPIDHMQGERRIQEGRVFWDGAKREVERSVPLPAQLEARPLRGRRGG